MAHSISGTTRRPHSPSGALSLVVRDDSTQKQTRTDHILPGAGADGSIEPDGALLTSAGDCRGTAVDVE